MLCTQAAPRTTTEEKVTERGQECRGPPGGEVLGPAGAVNMLLTQSFKNYSSVTTITHTDEERFPATLSKLERLCF